MGIDWNVCVYANVSNVFVRYVPLEGKPKHSLIHTIFDRIYNFYIYVRRVYVK